VLKRYKKSRDASLIFSVRRDILIFRLSNLSYNKLEHHHEQGRGQPDVVALGRHMGLLLRGPRKYFS